MTSSCAKARVAANTQIRTVTRKSSCMKQPL
jgi:hypothetical protein